MFSYLYSLLFPQLILLLKKNNLILGINRKQIKDLHKLGNNKSSNFTYTKGV